MALNIVLTILVTSFATYISRFLGVIISKKIKENSKSLSGLIVLPIQLYQLYLQE